LNPLIAKAIKNYEGDSETDDTASTTSTASSKTIRKAQSKKKKKAVDQAVAVWEYVRKSLHTICDLLPKEAIDDEGSPGHELYVTLQVRIASIGSHLNFYPVRMHPIS